MMGWMPRAVLWPDLQMSRLYLNIDILVISLPR
jgi:hypothetical protein